METIILDWSALSQIIRQGPQGVLEQSLRSSGSRAAIIDHGKEEIPGNHRRDFKEFKERFGVEEITIEADLTKDTLENRRLGVVFDANGRPRKSQLADAAIRWLEQERKFFSQGGYRLLSNDRGLIESIEKLAPNSTYQTNLDLLGRAVLRGDVSADQYKSFLNDFSLPDGRIRGIGSNFSNHLILSDEMLASIETVGSGGVLVPEHFSHLRPREVVRRFTKLLRGGAPVVVLGLGAVPVFSIVKARAEERSIPFAQAARELGLDFSEDDLKGLAADVGVDLAVSLTPVGVVKKAWDVLGNIDDIVAVTQLYGEAYPDNPVIQELAELATTVEGLETFKAYVYGRDALTGAVGGVIDGMLGDSGDEEETAEALAHLRASLQEGGAAQQAANSGATQAELAETLTFDLRQRMAAQQSLFAAEPTATADAPLTAPRPDAAALSGDTVLSDEKHVPMSAMPGLPGSAPLPQPSFTRDTVQSSLMSAEPMATAKTPLSAPQPDADSLSPDAGRMDGARAEAPASAGVEAGTNREPFARRTSYDTYRRLGLTPEEEAQAVEEFHALVKESYVDMGGDMEAAQLLAGRLFAFDWGLSAFAQAPEGTVLKHPVEKVYPELEGAGHDYIRGDVEAFLEARDIKAARWYLTPNEKTGRDRKKAWMDDQGYGPRMTLTYDDDTGRQHVVTDSYQADIRGPRLKQTDAYNRALGDQAAQYGFEDPVAAARANLSGAKLTGANQTGAKQTGAAMPVPRAKPSPKPLGQELGGPSRQGG